MEIKTIMFPATRIGDYVQSICKGVNSGPFLTGSMNTFTDGRSAVRLGDVAPPGIAISGSRKTFINGRPAVRLIDRVSCGIIMTSSTKTFIG